MKNFIIKIVSIFPFLYKFLPKKYYYDYYIFCCLIDNPKIPSYFNHFLFRYKILYEVDHILCKKGNLLDDFELCQKVVKESPYSFQNLPKDMQYNFEILRYALSHDLENLKYLSKSFIKKQINNSDFIDILLSASYSKGFEYLTKNFKSNKDFLIKAFNHFPSLNLKLDKNLAKDKELVEMACLSCSENLKYVNKEFKKNKEFILGLSSANLYGNEHNLLKYCDFSLLLDCDFVNRYLDKYWCFYSKYLTNETKDNKEIMLKLLKRSSLYYAYASKRLKGDIDIIKALSFDATYLLDKYLPRKYRKNSSLMFKVLDINYRAIRCFTSILKDRDIAKKLVSNNGLILENLNKFQNDFEICELAIEQNFRAFNYVKIRNPNKKFELLKTVLAKDKELTTFTLISNLFFKYQDRNSIIELLSINGKLLFFFPEYYNDRELVLIAVKSNGTAFKMASKELREDKEVILTALQDKTAEDISFLIKFDLLFDKEIRHALVEQNGENIKLLKCFTDIDVDLIDKAINNNPNAFRYLPTWCQKEKKYILKAVNYDGLLIKYADFFDEEICEIAVNNNCKAVKYIPNYVSNFKILWNKALLKNLDLLEYVVYNIDFMGDRLFMFNFIDDVVDNKASYSISKLVEQLNNYDYPYDDEVIVSKLLDFVNIPFYDIHKNLRNKKYLYIKCLDYDITIYPFYDNFKYDNDVILKVLDKDFSLLSTMDINYFDEEVCGFVINKFATYGISRNYDFEELSIIPQEFVEVIYNCVKENIDMFKESV